MRLRSLAESDAREAFDCGRESLNLWFRRHAWANQTSSASRVTVLADETGRIAGFVALSAAQIERAFLPKPLQRNRPDPIPVTLLGQLAVDRGFQGQGHAASLLFYSALPGMIISLGFSHWASSIFTASASPSSAPSWCFSPTTRCVARKT